MHLFHENIRIIINCKSCSQDELRNWNKHAASSKSAVDDLVPVSRWLSKGLDIRLDILLELLLATRRPSFEPDPETVVYQKNKGALETNKSCDHIALELAQKEQVKMLAINSANHVSQAETLRKDLLYFKLNRTESFKRQGADSVYSQMQK